MALFKFEWDEHSCIKLDTFKQRVMFMAYIIVGGLLLAFFTATFLWLPYWLFTGRNGYMDILSL